MNKVILFACMLFLLACGEEEKQEEQQEFVDQKSMPVADTIAQTTGDTAGKEDSTAPAAPVHTLSRGETLWDLCREQYGNRHYSDILAAYNGIEDVSQLKEGAAIAMPELWEMLTSERLGLDTIAAELESVLKARAIFMRHEKKLYEWRKDSVESLPPVMKADLEKAYSAIDLAVENLEAMEYPPRKMIGQLESVSNNLNNLSRGNHDGPYGYDLDMVHQRLVHAFKNGIAWAEAGYE